MALLRQAGVVIGLLVLGAPVGSDVGAQTLTQDEALELAFPRASNVERRTAYLDEAQLAEAEALAGPESEVTSGIVTHYVARRNGVPLGVAYFDAHRVRTLPEVLMVVVAPDGRVLRIEILAFHEPPEYRAPERWIDLFQDRVLDTSLSLRGDVPNMTGASLTSNAVTGAVRRILAIHEVIDPFEADPS